ncbi:hypothetical protein BDV98DRAFT_504137, partial [Pterulicium gracile]
NPGNNLHVSGLHTKVDSRDLEAAFAKAGRVQKASIMLDPHSRESRGFGFVTMESPEEAEAAIVMLNSSELMGKTMNVEKVGLSISHNCTDFDLMLSSRLVEAVPGPLPRVGTTVLPSVVKVRCFASLG